MVNVLINAFTEYYVDDYIQSNNCPIYSPESLYIQYVLMKQGKTTDNNGGDPVNGSLEFLTVDITCYR
jgi:hypothetical protein